MKIIDRTNETRIAKNGLNMTIIRYKDNRDIDIQFEDGYIAEHKSYYSFLKGEIKHPNYESRKVKNAKNRVGEMGVAKNGEKIEIIEYFDRKNITVKFEDGQIVRNCSYSKFQSENICKPIDIRKKRIGEVSTASNGQKMKIIDYVNSNDIKIEFEDKTVLEHIRYSSFKKGYVNNPNYIKEKPLKIKLIKEKPVAKIPKKSKKNKISKIKKQKNVTNLAKERVGETKTLSDGSTIKIIAYNKSRDIVIEFDDGTVAKHQKYDNFKLGKIHKPKTYLPLESLIGKEITSYLGQKYKIVKADGYSRITVQFEDGTTVSGRRYKDVLNGSVRNTNIKKETCPKGSKIDYQSIRVGETNIALNGQIMTIVKYTNATDIDVKFEDGTVIQHRAYSRFKKGSIANPNFRPFIGTSINETTILYYFSKIGFYKKYITKDKKYGNYEYDVFNKDLKLAIEYDGVPRTHTEEKDKRKNDDAQKHGVTIWRIRVPEVPKFNDKRNRIYNLRNSWLFTKDLEDTLKNIVSEINKIYGKSFELDINFKRDKEDILKFLKAKYYKKTSDRVGESIVAGNGQIMTIVDYWSFGDITVQFEDGTIVEHVRYSDFKLGNIANPKFSTRAHLHAKERVGEEKIANNGLKMKIIAYRHCHDIDVEFENGVVVCNVSYNNFVRGGIGLCETSRKKKSVTKNKKPVTKRKINSEHLGESTIAKNGLNATIIEYNKYSDIKVQFEDGVVVKSTYDSFKQGYIKHPKINALVRKDHIGEIKTANNGQKMTIINYRSGNDIDVRFKDGTIVEHKGYKEFKKGSIANPSTDTKNYLGKTFTANNGQNLTIIEYINNKKVTVKFEDGTIVKNRTMSNIINGQVSNPNFNPKIAKNSAKIIGETNINNAGFKMEIIAYNSSKNIDIKFEDGTIARHCDYYAFKNGAIRKPIPSRIGERNRNSKGEEFEIIEYNSSRDITIKFLDDNTILKHKHYSDFKNGYFRKPKK